MKTPTTFEMPARLTPAMLAEVERIERQQACHRLEMGLHDAPAEVSRTYAWGEWAHGQSPQVIREACLLASGMLPPEYMPLGKLLAEAAWRLGWRPSPSPVPEAPVPRAAKPPTA